MPVLVGTPIAGYECCHSLYTRDLPTRLILFRALLGSDFQWWKPAVFAGVACAFGTVLLYHRAVSTCKDQRHLESLIINGSFKVQMDGVDSGYILPHSHYPFSSSTFWPCITCTVHIIPRVYVPLPDANSFDCELLTSSQTNITWKASTDSLHYCT